MPRLHRIIVFLVLSCPLAVFAGAPKSAQAGSEVTICHIPPGDPANAHTIVVDSHSVPAHLAHGDHLGACAPACQDPGGTCTSDTDCCGGTCTTSGQCCMNDGGSCETGADCCGGLECTGSYKTCASDCTIGPELGGDYCGLGLDCCEGACLFGTCWSGYTCHLPGAPCTDNPLSLNDLCCFGYSCINGLCAL